MSRSAVLAVVMTLGALTITVSAVQTPAPAGPKVIEIQKLRDNLFVLTSSSPADRALFSGGNVAVFVTGAGVTLVDTKLAGWGQAMLDSIKTVTGKPVVRIINTHTHGDHTGNNNLFGDAVEIVAHQNTKANMERMDAFKGAGARYLPNRTYADKLSLGSGKDQIDLYHLGAGHTSGDTFVVFPALRVLHTGDMFAWKDGPLCDRANGGSCVAFPRTLAAVVSTIKNIDTVIPGHSPMTTMKDVAEYQRFTADLLSASEAAMKAGKSVDEAAASFSAAKYPGYTTERVKAAMQAAYDELKK